VTPWFVPTADDEPSLSPDGTTVFVVGEDRALRALDAATGAERWALAAPPGGGRWAAEQAEGDAVLATVVEGEDEAARRVCRVAAGRVTWCTRSDRPLAGLHVGPTGTGAWVVAGNADGRLLDAATGALRGPWVPANEVHLYHDLAEPHDTRWFPNLAVLGTFGGVTLAADAGRDVIEGWRGGAVAWTLPVEGGSAEVFRIGRLLGRLGPDGALRWHHTLSGRVVPTAAGPVVVDGATVVGLDRDRGAERFRVTLAAAPIVVGERGEVGLVGASTVAWVDPGTGAVTATTPLPPLRGGSVWALPTGLLAMVGDDATARWALVRPDGSEAWSRAGAVQVDGDLVVDLRTRERLDPATGAVLAVLPGLPVATAGGRTLGWDGARYVVY
jgi:hypothetical protein